MLYLKLPFSYEVHRLGGPAKWRGTEQERRFNSKLLLNQSTINKSIIKSINIIYHSDRIKEKNTILSIDGKAKASPIHNKFNFHSW